MNTRQDSCRVRTHPAESTATPRTIRDSSVPREEHMTASSRFGYSMVTGAVVSGALVAWEMTHSPAKIAAAAAANYESPYVQSLVVFVKLTVVIGLLLFGVAPVAGRRRPAQSRRRPEPPVAEGYYPAPASQARGRRSGRR